jgi:alpha-ketoglutaric semialdehyde dehydrogenase
LTETRESITKETLTGRSMIGFKDGASETDSFHAMNPVTADPLPPSFFPVTPSEIDIAASLAAKAFVVYSRTTGREKAAFLRLTPLRVK